MENETKIIDGRNKLRPSHLKEFIDTINDENVDISLCITSSNNEPQDLGSLKAGHFVEAFVNGEYVQFIQHNDDVVDFVTDNVVLEMAGIDLVYWQETARRRNSILKEFTETVSHEVIKNANSKPDTKESTTNIRIGLATLTDDGLKDVVVSDGSKQAMVLWMNHHLVQRHILPKDQFVVFCLNYKDGDENNIDLWKSLAELVEEKKIVMM